MEFTKDMKICHWYGYTDGYPSTIIGVFDVKKLDGSDIKTIVYEYGDGSVGESSDKELNNKFDVGNLKIGGCSKCDVVKCEHHPKYVPPPPPDTEEKLKEDIKVYAGMLADCAITGDVYEDQVYKDIMDFLRRKNNLVIKYYNEHYDD